MQSQLKSAIAEAFAQADTNLRLKQPGRAFEWLEIWAVAAGLDVEQTTAETSSSDIDDTLEADCRLYRGSVFQVRPRS